MRISRIQCCKFMYDEAIVSVVAGASFGIASAVAGGRRQYGSAQHSTRSTGSPGGSE